MQRLAEERCGCCDCEPCECCEKCGKRPCCCPKGEGLDPRAMLTQHTTRHVFEYTVPPGYGSGQGEKPQGPMIQPDPQTTAGHNIDYMVGEDVVIADEGKSYQAKVKAKRQDGTLELSFGPNKPVKDRFYRKEEIQRIKPGNVAVAP
jgi:hypothetical protein